MVLTKFKVMKMIFKKLGLGSTLEAGDNYETFLESWIAMCHSVGIYLEPILCCLDQDPSHMVSAINFQVGSDIIGFNQNCKIARECFMQRWAQ